MNKKQEDILYYILYIIIYFIYIFFSGTLEKKGKLP